MASRYDCDELEWSLIWHVSLYSQVRTVSYVGMVNRCVVHDEGLRNSPATVTINSVSSSLHVTRYLASVFLIKDNLLSKIGSSQ